MLRRPLLVFVTFAAMTALAGAIGIAQPNTPLGVTVPQMDHSSQLQVPDWKAETSALHREIAELRKQVETQGQEIVRLKNHHHAMRMPYGLTRLNGMAFPIYSEPANPDRLVETGPPVPGS